jgi:phosphohistidine phosphatase
MQAEHRLVLFRHAKSAYPSGVPDHERPLAGKGRRNAQAAGRWFVSEGPRLGLALCSDAVRARHTWEVVHSVLVKAKLDVPVRIEPLLYGADPEELVDLVRSLLPDLSNVVVIGHEPTMSATALILAGNGSDPNALAQVERKFPTGAIAVLRLAGSWSDLGPGSARLETFARPRA